MSEIAISEVPIPESVDAPDAADFIAAIGVRTAVNAHDSGTDDESRPPEEMLPGWRKQEFEPKRLFIARRDGQVVGRGVAEYRLGEAEDTAWLLAEVVPSARGQGVGRAIAEHVESVVREAGKRRAIVYAPCWKVGGDRLAAPTGFGDVAADTAETRLLLSMGYRLEQVERGSRLMLPLDETALQLVHDEAAEIAGPDYRVHLFGDRTPERWREDIAHLLTRMSTDAPSAGLEEPEDPWTVERLLADEEEEADGPRTAFVAAVEHVPTGRLAGFTELVAPDDMTRPVDQEDTIVLIEHRGHRLGLLLKAANLLHLQRVRPGHPSVVTYNAEENRPMLDVNEALGFVPFVYEGAWRKDL
ncbi:MAG: GNAT family N-acetyltransferase [Microcella sp.]|uniref:GNAT family N-acetyltransferase n=1 Tax=Microcella sp. TaxID=1913979 RepID=UPI0024CC78DD|nr:GNAT family N-acetyltransferase [Microcella sp.]UYN83834.1 MAG: GNAT family N-acetyltransferase [Microcella sp.]